MKKTIQFAALFILLSLNLSAQYSTDWIRPADSYLKTGVMIARDLQDNVVVTGFIQSQNIYTRKYDKFGNFLWEQSSTSGIQSNYEKPIWINTDNNNNVFVTGYRYSIGSGKEYPTAMVILKYNTSGALLWKQQISIGVLVSNSVGVFNLRSEVDNNGNLYIGTVAANPSGFIFYKLDPNGTLLVSTSNNLNGVNGFNGMRLKGNKIVMTGRSGNLSQAPVIAWDTSGNLLFTAVYTGQGGNDVEIDDAGNIYLLSSYSNLVTASSSFDLELFKLNDSGTQLWKQNYDFGGAELATRLAFSGDRVTVIARGTTAASPYTDWITLQVNSAGTMLWNKRYDGTRYNDEKSNYVVAKPNGDVFVTGVGGPSPSTTNLSYLRMITIKYNGSGSVNWVDSLNYLNGWGLACTLASDNSLFVVSGSYMTAYHFIDQTVAGTCDIPTGLNAANITSTSATFSWSPVNSATLYHLRYKTSAATVWTVLSTNQTSINVTGFTLGTTYNYAVEAVCNSGPSGYSADKTFSTPGVSYCTTGGLNSTQEYLNLVWIGSIQNSTGNNNGYADFTNLSTILTPGATVTGYLRATLNGNSREYYRVWIDYNKDGDFSDAGEQVASFNSRSIGYNAISFVVPVTALPGTTRMRVSMKYGSYATPCGTYSRGETEDYSVVIPSPTPLTYCTTGGVSIANEWISTVNVSAVNPLPGQSFILNNSFINTSGYTDFTNLSATLNPNDSVRINVGTGTPDLTNLTRHFSIWIDYNQDKDFNDPGEQIINNLITNTLSADIGFRVPAAVMAGSTRLRIVMSHDDILSPCGDYPGGETEDYTVVFGNALITQNNLRLEPLNTIVNTSKGIFPNPATDVLFIKGLTKVSGNYKIEIFDLTGRKVLANTITGNSINIKSLKTGIYFINIQQNNTTVYSERFIKN